jgi:RNA polymerase sigma factor (sigma-70 family)
MEQRTQHVAILEHRPTSKKDNKKLNDYIEQEYSLLERKALCIVGPKWSRMASESLNNLVCDLIDGAYMEADEKFAEFDPERGPFVNWYGWYMQNVFYRMQRTVEHHRSKVVSDYPVECELLAWGPTFEDLDHHLIQCETVDDLKGRLNPFDNSLLDSYYRQDLPAPEIAQRLQWTLNRVHGYLHRIKCYARSIAAEIMQDERQRNAEALPDADNTRGKGCRPTRKRVAVPGRYATNIVPKPLPRGEPHIQPV